MTVDRRTFTRSVIAAGVGMAFSFMSEAADAPPMAVAIAQAERLKRLGNDVDHDAAALALGKLMMALTGASRPENAWKLLVEPHHKVAIKLSCLPGKYLSSSPGLVMAIVKGLRSAGVEERNIWIWERTGRELEDAGFPLSDSGVRVLGTDSLPGGGYAKDFSFSGSVGTLFSQIVDMADVLINVPVLKDHDISGISCAMKNFYGAIYNPNKFHGNRCDPYIADLYNQPALKGKCRLHVCDASRIQLHNGPAFYPKYAKEWGGILASLNPVALDATGWRLIERERKSAGLPSLKDEGRLPSYIFTASKLGLGPVGEEKIKIIAV